MSTVLDDLSVVIGHTACERLAGWYAGRVFHVPSSLKPSHIKNIIGPDKYADLIEIYAGDALHVPQTLEAVVWQRNRQICDLRMKGVSFARIGTMFDLSERQCRKLYTEIMGEEA